MRIQARASLTCLLLALALLLGLPGRDASAATMWSGPLSGSQEVPANASNATGLANVSYDPNSLVLQVDMSWSGLSSPAFAGHIHCCADPSMNVGVAISFTGLPVATSGTYLNTYDLGLTSSFSASFLAGAGGGTVDGARAALLAGLDAGKAYVNLHDSVFPAGELRGNLQPVPEPGTATLFGGGTALLGGLARRRWLRAEKKR